MLARYTLALLLAAGIGGNALAGDDWYADRYGSRYERRYDDPPPRHYHHAHRHDRQVEYIVVERPVPVYTAPRVVYQEPVVVYRDRVIHDTPVYREAPPRRYYRDDAPVRYRDEGMSRGTGQVLGAVAGGIVGSRFGDGNGRLAATAAGAVLGGLIGGELARD